MELKSEDLINAAFRIQCGVTPLSETSYCSLGVGEFGEAFQTEDDRVVKLTTSFTEALTASVSSRLPSEHMPNYGLVIEVVRDSGERTWLIEQELIDTEHELVEVATSLLSASPSISHIDSFDFDFNDSDNDWAFESGLSEDQIMKVITDLQQSMFAFEMTGFVHTDIKSDNIGVKKIDGIDTLVLIDPFNHQLEEAYRGLNASITDLDVPNQSVSKLTMNQCVENDRKHTSLLDDDFDMSYQIDENLMPSNPISLSR